MAVTPDSAPDRSDDAVVATEIIADQPWNRFVREQLPGFDFGGDDRLEIEVIPPPRQRHEVRGRFENNLSRKGVFDLRPSRPEHGISATVRRTDVVGKTTLTYTLGSLGPFEMDMIAWILGQWERGKDTVSFNLREVGRAMDVAWKGKLGAAIKDGLLRIKATTITGRVWDATERKHTTASFSIFDRVEIVEERSTERGPALRPATVSVTLSSWVTTQLRAGQYSDFNWEAYRARLTTPFARRLYLFLESQEGDQDGTLLRLRIDAALSNTLGTDDGTQNPSRFRQRLRREGEAICKAVPYYTEISIKAGARIGEHWLEVRRSPEWRSNRMRNRRRALARSAA